ncbi:MAG: preprotein translocase subunit SecA, partial [Flavobacteriaceae bacterium]
MSILNSILKTFVGDKTKKDLANIKPLVSQINQLQAQLETLSADALRAKTEVLKQGIQDNRKAEDEQIQNLKEQLAQQKDIDARESLYLEIDELEEQSYQSTKAFLDQILPEAFAIMKETARRFATQSQITVTATATDRT